MNSTHEDSLAFYIIDRHWWNLFLQQNPVTQSLPNNKRAQSANRQMTLEMKEMSSSSHFKNVSATPSVSRSLANKCNNINRIKNFNEVLSINQLDTNASNFRKRAVTVMQSYQHSPKYGSPTPMDFDADRTGAFIQISQATIRQICALEKNQKYVMQSQIESYDAVIVCEEVWKALRSWYQLEDDTILMLIPMNEFKKSGVGNGMIRASHKSKQVSNMTIKTPDRSLSGERDI